MTGLYLGTQPLTLPDGWEVYVGSDKVYPADPLSTWLGALGNVAIAQARKYVIGNSIEEGTGATARLKRAIDLVLTSLVADYPVSGQGRSQYLPAVYGCPSSGQTVNTPWGGLWASATAGTVTPQLAGIGGGAGTAASTFGPGQRSVNLGASGSVTYTVTGSNVDLWFAAGGSFTYSIDGGTTSSAINTSTWDANAQLYPLSLGSSGTHTIKITRTAGTVRFLGMTIFNGARDKGVASFDACHWSAQIKDFWDYSNPSAAQNAKLTRNLQLVAPHLVIINVLINDAGNIGQQGITECMARLNGLLGAVRAAAPDASIAFVMPYDQIPVTSLLSDGNTVQDLKDTVSAWAGTNGLAYIDISASMTSVMDDDGTLYQPDGEHLTDAGNVVYAQILSQALDPNYVVPAPVIGVGASVSSNAATSAGITTQASGSNLYAVTTDTVAAPTSLTLTDNKGNTFTKVTTLTYGGAYSVALWKCENAVGGAGHTFTISNGGGRASMSLVEVLNAATASSIRNFNGTATVGAGPWPSGNVAALAGDLVLGLIAYDYTANPTTATPASGYTKLTESTASVFMHTAVEWQLAAADGNFSPSFNCSPTGNAGGGFAFGIAVKPA